MNKHPEKVILNIDPIHAEQVSDFLKNNGVDFIYSKSEPHDLTKNHKKMGINSDYKIFTLDQRISDQQRSKLKDMGVYIYRQDIFLSGTQYYIYKEIKNPAKEFVHLVYFTPKQYTKLLHVLKEKSLNTGIWFNEFNFNGHDLFNIIKPMPKQYTNPVGSMQILHEAKLHTWVASNWGSNIPTECYFITNNKTSNFNESLREPCTDLNKIHKTVLSIKHKVKNKDQEYDNGAYLLIKTNTLPNMIIEAMARMVDDRILLIKNIENQEHLEIIPVTQYLGIKSNILKEKDDFLSKIKKIVFGATI